MIPIASLDAAMLLAETAEMPLHNLGVLRFESGGMDASELYGALYDRIGRRIHLAPTFRRRVIEGRFGLADLRFIEDPRFHLDHHLLRARIPAPGDQAALERFVGDYAGRTLPRHKPLWEMVVLEGVAGGELYVVAKVHHAAMDGLRLAKVVVDLLGADDAGRDAPTPWHPDREPGRVALALDAARALARKPALVAHGVREVAEAYRGRKRARPAAQVAPAPHVRVQPTPWRGALSAQRATAFADVSLEQLKTIGAAYGTTLNDVVLAASAGALRSWLLTEHALPPGPLVANVPITLRSADAGDEHAGNKVSMLRIALPTHVADPVERLRAVNADTQRAKASHRASGANPYSRLTDLVLNLLAPRVITSAMGLYSRLGVADLHPAPWNVVVSNVPGPRQALTCGRATLRCIYPFGPVQHGSGLNLTVMSTEQRLALGVMACREKVPHVDTIAAAFVDQVRLLLERAALDAHPPAI